MKRHLLYLLAAFFLCVQLPSLSLAAAGPGVVVIPLGGDDNSSPGFVVITAATGNSPPVASAGPDQNVVTGNMVTLDGGSSTDGDNDPLTYSWTILAKPTGSGIVLSDETVVNPTFTPDVAGSYTVQLIVNDGTVSSEADTIVITVSDAAPLIYEDNLVVLKAKNFSAAISGYGSRKIDADAGSVHLDQTYSHSQIGPNQSSSMDGTYSVDEDGRSTLVYQNGVIKTYFYRSSDDSLFLGGRSDVGNIQKITMGVKKPTVALSAADLDGEYAIACFSRYSCEGPQQRISAFGTTSFNGSGSYTSSVSYSESIDYPPTAPVENNYGAAELTGTYTVNSNGFVTMDENGDDIKEGYMAEDGKVLVLTEASDECYGQKMVVLIKMDSSATYSTSTLTGEYAFVDMQLGYTDGDPPLAVWSSESSASFDGSGLVDIIANESYNEGSGGNIAVTTYNDIPYSIDSSGLMTLDGEYKMAVSPDGMVFIGAPTDKTHQGLMIGIKKKMP